MSGSRSVMSNNLSVLSKVMKCTRYDLSIKSFNVLYLDKESDIIHVNVVGDMLHMRHNNLITNQPGIFNSTEIDYIINRLCTM